MVNNVNSTAATEVTVESAFNEIKSSMLRSTVGVLDAARVLIDFFSRDDYPKLKKELISNKLMGESTLSQYQTIGRCAVLREVVEHLPASFNSLYHLAKLEKENAGFIKSAIAKGELQPCTTLDKIRQWDGKGSGKQEGTSIVLQFEGKIDKEAADQIRQKLVEYAISLGVKVRVPAEKKAVAKKEVK